MKPFFLFAMLAIVTGGYSQTVSNKIIFPKGQKLEVVTETKRTNVMSVMGQNMETEVTTTLTESFDVENATADSATIEYKVKRLLLNAKGGPTGALDFDSDKEGDRKGELGKLLEKGLKNKYAMTLDAYGNVVSVKADDDNPNGKDENAMAMEMLAAQLGFRISTPKAGDPSIFRLLPKEVKENDSWSDSSAVNGQKKKTVYKISRIDAGNVTVDFTETTDTDTKQEMMGTSANVKGTDVATGQIILDTKSGLLKQKTFTINNSGSIEAQGMTIPSSAKGTTTITVKYL